MRGAGLHRSINIICSMFVTHTANRQIGPQFFVIAGPYRIDIIFRSILSSPIRLDIGYRYNYRQLALAARPCVSTFLPFFDGFGCLCLLVSICIVK